MEYVGRVEDEKFSFELYSLVERFESALSEFGDFVSIRNVCNFSRDISFVFHSSDVFLGRVSFSSDGVIVSIQLRPEDPVLALVKLSKSPEKYYEELDKDFEAFVEKYKKMGELMKKVVRS